MPNSLRARINKLAYQGHLSREDADRVRDALELADNVKQLMPNDDDDMMIINKTTGWAALKDGTKVDVNLAVEKQIPMKPTKLHTYRYCPRCDYRLTTKTISVNGERVAVHCECCGQAIADWSDEDA